MLGPHAMVVVGPGREAVLQGVELRLQPQRHRPGGPHRRAHGDTDVGEEDRGGGKGLGPPTPYPTPHLARPKFRRPCTMLIDAPTVIGEWTDPLGSWLIFSGGEHANASE